MTIARTVGVGSLLLLVLGRLHSAEPTLETKVQAAFLFNFAKFVDWPTNAFSSPSDPLIIGVLGRDPFGEVIDQTVNGKTVNGRPLVVRRYASGESAVQSHILFVAESEGRRMSQITGDLAGEPVLTVSTMENFLDRGGMVRFVRKGENVRFEIQLTTVKDAQLKISSKLLHIAEVRQ